PSGGHGLIPHFQFLWSTLRTTSTSGVPSVVPCLSPASTSTLSCSICCRGERPYPCWRRLRSASIASRSSSSPAGSPVTIATSAGPCDSPAVATRRGMRQSLDRDPNRVPHDLDGRRDPGPELERPSALADERLEPVHDLAARRAGGRDERGLGPVGCVGELDHDLARLGLDEELVPHRRRVHDQVA